MASRLPRIASDSRLARVAAVTAAVATEVASAVGVAAHATAWAATAPPLFLIDALSAVQPGRLAAWAASRLVRLGAGAGLAAALAFGASRAQRASTEAAPQALLALFTERQAVAHNLKDLSSLPVDTLHVYADAACVQADDFGAAQRALTLQLGDVPARVRDALVAKALVPGVSVTKSEQNTAFGIEAAGSASTYMAFYATRYQPAGLGLAASYATCVVVSGVDLRVGEEVVEWQTAERAVQVGTRPCNCLIGGWGCAACPEMAKEVTRRPVLARHALSLDHQMQLHRWMVKQAVDRARLVGPREPAASALRDPAEFLAGNLGWLGPSRGTYLGNPAVRGTVQSEEGGEVLPEE